MSPTIIGLIGICLLIILLFSRMWIAFAMAIVGFGGYIFLRGWHDAITIIGSIPYDTIAQYPIACLPLFIFMGTLLANAGISSDLYESSDKWLGQLPGGLAMATVGACGAFAAVCSSSSATAVTIGKVALREMKKYRYDDSLASGSVAAGGTLGILIPPSAGFILYGILTQNSIGKLFMAGILPGVLLMFLMIIIICFWSLTKPGIASKGPKVGFKEKLYSLKNIWPIILLFLFVLGGIYGGIFTPTEAGALGSFGAIIVTLVSRRLTLRKYVDSMLETGQVTAMLLILLVGAFIFSPFLAVSKLPFAISDMISGFSVSPYLVLLAIVVLYIILGMFLEIITCQILTLPILYPAVIAAGFDPIWFGVIFVITQEMGLITPPVGLNVFVLATVTDIPVNKIYKGTLPFVIAQLGAITIITIFPKIALLIPGGMK